MPAACWSHWNTSEAQRKAAPAAKPVASGTGTSPAGVPRLLMSSPDRPRRSVFAATTGTRRSVTRNAVRETTTHVCMQICQRRVGLFRVPEHKTYRYEITQLRLVEVRKRDC